MYIFEGKYDQESVSVVHSVDSHDDEDIASGDLVTLVTTKSI